MDFGADEIEIVEHLRRFGEPGFARRRRRWGNITAWTGLWGDADARERAGEVESGSGFRGSKMGLYVIARRRGRYGRQSKGSENSRSQPEVILHDASRKPRGSCVYSFLHQIPRFHRNVQCA